MTKKTPSILEQRQSYSAIVEELEFKDGAGGKTQWIPEDAVMDYITYEDRVLKGDGVYTPEDADFIRSARVEKRLTDVLYSCKITENGIVNIPEVYEKTCVRKVNVNVDFGDIFEELKTSVPGTYTSIKPGGFDKVTVEVYGDAGENPNPDGVVDNEEFYSNGVYYIDEQHPDKEGWKHVIVDVINGVGLSLSRSDLTQTLSGYVASCMTPDGLQIFSGQRWFKPNGTVEEISFNADGLSAFYVSDDYPSAYGIHLVGQKPGSAAEHHRYYDGAWHTVSTNAPGHWVSPNILNCDGRIFCVGSGYVDQGLSGASTAVYEYIPETNTWTMRADMGDLICLFNSDPVVWWGGKVHAWKGYHMTFDIDTYTWTKEENTYSNLFSNTAFNVFGDPEDMRVVALRDDICVMLNAAYSTQYTEGEEYMTTLTVCQKVDGRYIYRPLGTFSQLMSAVYPWYIQKTRIGLGQCFVVTGYFTAKIIGTPGAESNKMTTAQILKY